MSTVPLCVVAGRAESYEPARDAAVSALSAMGAIFYDDMEVVENVANQGFGIMKADSYISRDIIDLAFAHDNDQGLVTCTVLTPSLVPRIGNDGPLISSVLPFVADKMEDPCFFVFLDDVDSIRYHRPVEAYMRRIDSTMRSEDYVIDDEKIKERSNDIFVPAEIAGMKSLGQFALPYMKELADTSRSSSAGGTIDDLIQMLTRLKDTPVEMEAMLELEYGPVFEYFWMAISDHAERENYVDRELTRLYSSRSAKSMAVYSDFDNEMVTYSAEPVSALMEKHRAFLEGKGVDLSVAERRVVG